MPSQEDYVLDRALKAALTEQSTAHTEEHVAESKAKLGAAYERHGLGVLAGRAADIPDVPPCDYCGKEFAGNLICTRCESTFYCSKECQRAAWKLSGHKQSCDSMKEECELAGKEVVWILANKDISCLDRVDEYQWKRLDGAGPYKAALDQGLNAALKGLCEEEIEQVLKRWQMRCQVSYVEWIMCVMWRSGRQEGKKTTGAGAFSHIDSYRVKKYVHSSPDAFERWFEASLAMITVFLDPMIGREERNLLGAHKTARNVAASWSMVWTSPKASKAIILGISKEADEAAVNRGKWMIKQLKKVLPKFWNLPEGHVGESIEGHLNQFAGMVSQSLLSAIDLCCVLVCSC
jgi:hypothetical protein